MPMTGAVRGRHADRKGPARRLVHPRDRLPLCWKFAPNPLEVLLHSRHSDEPFPSDSQDPVYWVTPRHLAGDDGALAEQVSDTLTGLDWRVWPTARDTLLHVSPDGLCGAEWLLASYPFELGGLPVAWQVSARSHTDSVMAEWNAYFTAGVPHEVLTDFLLALDARRALDAGFDGPEWCSGSWVPGAGSATQTALAPRPSTLASPPASPWSCCLRSSRTPIRALVRWAGKPGRSLVSVIRICGARASAPASRFASSLASSAGTGGPPDA